MAEALALDEPLLSQGLGPTVPADDPALALNTALAGDGVVITVSPDVAIERPIHLVFVNTSRDAGRDGHAIAGAWSAAAPARLFVETHEGRDQSDYQVNTVLQLVVGDRGAGRSYQDHARGQRRASTSRRCWPISARGRSSMSSSFTTGGAVVRNQLFVLLAGEGTEANLRGLSLLAGRQHADTTLAVDHAAAGCQSREVFKAVVDDEARARVPGQDHGAAAGAEDRREDDVPGVAVVG